MDRSEKIPKRDFLLQIKEPQSIGEKPHLGEGHALVDILFIYKKIKLLINFSNRNFFAVKIFCR